MHVICESNVNLIFSKFFQRVSHYTSYALNYPDMRHPITPTCVTQSPHKKRLI